MIFKLTPATKDYLWGGTNLKALYGKTADTEIIAETWELSCHKHGESTLPNGSSLSSYLSENPAAAGTACAKFNQFPLLVKLIDAQGDLSVQVHPNDAYALKNENQLGKTEMWYVMNAQEGAALYCGFKRTVTKSEFKESIENGSLCDLLNRIPVKKGDIFFIEAGTIHAIGAGIVIAEIQQSSDVTYRVYDYKRKGPDGNERELHVDKAIEVTNLSAFEKPVSFAPHVGFCDYFTVDYVNLSGKKNLCVDEGSFKAILAIGGAITAENNGDTVSLKAGDTAFISAASGNLELEGNGEALIIYVR